MNNEVEVLEHGNIYDEKCKFCGCHYGYVKKYIKTATWSEDYFKYTECPECGYINELEV